VVRDIGVCWASVLGWGAWPFNRPLSKACLCLGVGGAGLVSGGWLSPLYLVLLVFFEDLWEGVLDEFG